MYCDLNTFMGTSLEIFCKKWLDFIFHSWATSALKYIDVLSDIGVKRQPNLRSIAACLSALAEKYGLVVVLDEAQVLLHFKAEDPYEIDIFLKEMLKMTTLSNSKAKVVFAVSEVLYL